MSHRVAGKVGLNCSLDILRASIIAFKPEWEKNIQVDPNGNLQTDSRWQGKQGGNFLVIKYPGVDIGFVKGEKGEFKISYDPYETNRESGLDKLEEKISQSVAEIHTILIAHKNNMKIVSKDKVGNATRIVMIAPKNVATKKA